MADAGNAGSHVVPLEGPDIYEFRALSQGKSANCGTAGEV
jgi:hypothetical protein